MKLGKFELRVPEKVSGIIGMGSLKLREASPEILLGAGILCMGGAIVTAVRAARKHDYIVVNHEEQLEEAKCEYIIPDDYEVDVDNEEKDFHMKGLFEQKTEKQIARDVRKVYFHTFVEFVKLYSPTITLSAVSVICFVSSHNIQAHRFTELSGAYMGLKEAFDQYQARNIELNGKTNHEMCKYGWKEVEVEEEDPDTGEIVKEKKKVPAYEGLSEEEFKEMMNLPFHDHLITFDEKCSAWKGIANLDQMTLYSAEADIQRLVRVRGWAVVNDLYDYLSMERTEQGMYEGWVRGCGPVPVLNIEDAINQDALRGYRNQSWVLDPNVHGNVLALLNQKRKEKEAFEENLIRKRMEEEAKQS